MSVKALQDYIFTTKYSRHNADLGRRETFEESVHRVMSMHRMKYKDYNIEKEIKFCSDAVKDRLVLGSQRALQFGGTPILKKEARIFNCTTSYCDRPRFFQECLWLLLCGCGTGFSVQKHHIAKLPNIHAPSGIGHIYSIPDTIEGWADSLGLLLASYGIVSPEFDTECYRQDVRFDYSLIRPEGAILASGSGKAPGPAPLRNALEKIRELLTECIGRGQTHLRPIDAYDIVMHASDAVLSGGVRRSATICMFSVDDEEMLTSKTGDWFIKNPQRGRSNNSAVLLRDSTSRETFNGMMKSVKEFGEPGFVWADSTEIMYNPCVEIALFPTISRGEVPELAASGDPNEQLSGFAFCNLCEINMKACSTPALWERACRAAALLGTMQAGYSSFEYLGPVSEAIAKREALLGCSMTGMMDNPKMAFNPELQQKMAQLILDVNAEFAPTIGVRPTARATCVKPAGCRPLSEHVTTDQGILTLRELLEDHPEDEDWQSMNGLDACDGGKVTKTFRNGMAQTATITLKNGRKMESTLNHPWAVVGKGFVRSDALCVGDVIVTVLGAYTKQSEPALVSVPVAQHFNAGVVALPTVMSPELAYLAGCWCGNGSFSSHKKRVRFVHGQTDVIAKYSELFTKVFGIQLNVLQDPQGRWNADVGRGELYDWLHVNGLAKSKSKNLIEVPKVIRTASKESILAFIAGYADCDGCFHSNTFCIDSASEAMMRSVQVVGEAVGISFGLSHNTLGSNHQDIKSIWKVHAAKMSSKAVAFDAINRWSVKAKNNPIKVSGKVASGDQYRVVSVHNNAQPVYTADIEVAETSSFLDGGLRSHNTTSCILGTSSGIHAHHAKRYFRRAQGNKLEGALQYFALHNPRHVEDSVWSANKTDKSVIFCIEISDDALTKGSVNALELLNYVKLTQNNWVAAGRVTERCAAPFLRHNVSNTINVQPDEWDAVAAFIYDNRDSFAGISLLSHSGDKDYPQAPFCEVFTPSEILSKYGDGCLMASGLIVDGCHAFNNNLWAACSCALGIGESLTGSISAELTPELQIIELQARIKKIDWVRRSLKFAKNYFGGDVKRMTYALKDVHNWKLWCDLNREYQDVDWALFSEAQDNTKDVSLDAACAGGKCEILNT